MSLVQPGEVAPFLGVESDAPGLVESIENAEALTAANLNIQILEADEYTEAYTISYDQQQILPEHGPINEIVEFVLNDEDVTSDVVIDPTKYSIVLAEPGPMWRDQRGGRFSRFDEVSYTYSAGWTADTLPMPIRQYIYSWTGLTLNNLLASGIYDTKLGDMTIKIQRETLMDNMKPYERMLSRYARWF